MVQARDIFVVGGLPTKTYNPRTSFELEERLESYLEGQNVLLSITGPTKSGKTVLVRTVIPRDEGIWIPGGAIHNESDFWDYLTDRLGGFTEYTETTEAGDNASLTGELGGEAAIGPLLKVSTKFGGTLSSSGSTTTAHSKERSKKIAALESLAGCGLPLIIDDFHYIDTDAQARIIRALKDLVFDGLRVILLAVPHRRFDAVRVEREMTGRIQFLPIPEWTDAELATIPNIGFPELNLLPEPNLVAALTSEAFHSPHLMQDFCHRLALRTDAKEKLPSVRPIELPDDWSQFLRDSAKDLARPSFDRLAVGPRQRSDRKERHFVDGTSGDIYNTVLRALSNIKPLAETIEYATLRTSISDILAEPPPQMQEITRVLEKMVEIANEDETGVPVLDWDAEQRRVHITDPFFAFYLKWGVDF